MADSIFVSYLSTRIRGERTLLLNLLWFGRNGDSSHFSLELKSFNMEAVDLLSSARPFRVEAEERA